jgi:hypothetical protein
MKIAEFNKLAADIKMKPDLHEAVLRVLVKGDTWANAAGEMKVSESSIKRAIDRMQTLICPCCKQRIKK